MHAYKTTNTALIWLEVVDCFKLNDCYDDLQATFSVP